MALDLLCQSLGQRMALSEHGVPQSSVKMMMLIWVWVNTYRYIFNVMNIHLPAMNWGSLGTRVLTHPHIKMMVYIPLH